MNEDRIMWNIGWFVLILVIILMLVLQVCNRTQNRSLNRVRADIVRTQQNIAKAEANFASYVRPEALRNLVSIVEPKSKPIRFNAAVSPSEIPMRGEKK